MECQHPTYPTCPARPQLIIKFEGFRGDRPFPRSHRKWARVPRGQSVMLLLPGGGLFGWLGFLDLFSGEGDLRLLPSYVIFSPPFNPTDAATLYLSPQ